MADKLPKGTGYSGSTEKAARAGDKAAIKRLQKDRDKLNRSDAFAEKIMQRDDLTEKEKMRLIRQVTENINTENEVALSKGGAVEFRNGGKVSLGKFKGSF